MLKKIIIHWL